MQGEHRNASDGSSFDRCDQHHRCEDRGRLLTSHSESSGSTNQLFSLNYNTVSAAKRGRRLQGDWHSLGEQVSSELQNGINPVLICFLTVKQILETKERLDLQQGQRPGRVRSEKPAPSLARAHHTLPEPPGLPPPAPATVFEKQVSPKQKLSIKKSEGVFWE